MNKLFKMDDTGRGLPVNAFKEATTRRVLQAYCASMGVTQAEMETLFRRHRHSINGREHADGSKKRFFDYSVDDSVAIFDGHRLETPAYVVLSQMYLRGFPGLTPHDGKDPRGVSFARYIIWSLELCR